MRDRKSSVFSPHDKRLSSGSGGRTLNELLRDKAVGGWSQAPGRAGLMFPAKELDFAFGGHQGVTEGC